MTFTEMLQVFGLIAGIIGVVMYALNFVLRFFVGLQAPPLKRTILTVGSAYLLAVVGFMFGGLPEYQLWSPLFGLPPALLLGFLEYREFKARWFEHVEQLPEGATLANDDWRVGLFIVGALIAAASVKVLLREI